MKRLFFLSIGFILCLYTFIALMPMEGDLPWWGEIIAIILFFSSGAGIVTLGLAIVKNIIKQIKETLK